MLMLYQMWVLKMLMLYQMCLETLIRRLMHERTCDKKVKKITFPNE